MQDVPDPESEVPKDVRDSFFNQMKSKQSERVRAHHRAAGARLLPPMFCVKAQM